MIQSDWDTRESVEINLSDILKKHPQVSDIVVSQEGKKIALIIEIEDKQFTAFVNGELWQSAFERICYPQFLSNGSLICLVLNNYQWSLAVDGETQGESFDYAWNLCLSRDLKNYAFNIKRDNSYSLCVDGKIWEEFFFDSRDLIISPDGTHAATYVRVKNPPLLDIFSFKEGVWTLAVDGKAWNKNFISIFGATFSSSSKSIAATVRLGQQEYTVAVNGELWDILFVNAWEPIFLNESKIALPAREARGWSLYIDGKRSWKRDYVQLWNLSVSPSGDKIAATAATQFGKWTVVVDDLPWKREFSQAVLAPLFSPDGKRVAAVVKEKNQWTVAVDGIPWEAGFDRIWSPLFSPDGRHIVAKAEREGLYLIVVDGKIGKDTFERLWDPLFSPEGDRVLIRGIKNNKYIRKILTLPEIFR